MAIMTSPLLLKWRVVKRHLTTIVSFIFAKALLLGGMSLHAMDYWRCSTYVLELCASCDMVATSNADEVCHVLSSGYGVLLALISGYLLIDFIMGCTMLLEEDEVTQAQDLKTAYRLEPLLFHDGLPVRDFDGSPVLKVFYNGVVVGLYKPVVEPKQPKPVSIAKPHST